MQTLEIETTTYPKKSIKGFWQLFLIDKPNAKEQMLFDESLAKEARLTFRLFKWPQPALSLGLKQAPPSWVNESVLEQAGIELVRRPTGGGVAIHGSDLSFSIIVPHLCQLNLRDLMNISCQSLARGLRDLGSPVECVPEYVHSGRICYCLTDPSPYSLMIGKRKICGLAIRRFESSWLVQGSILVGSIPSVFKQVMPEEVQDQFSIHSITLENASSRPVTYEEAIESIISSWKLAWGIPCFAGRPDLLEDLVFGKLRCRRGSDAL